jgi:hypothetical protein
MRSRSALGRRTRSRSEQVAVQVQFGGGYLVELRDHPGPVQLDQGPDERPEPEQFIASAGQQPDGRAPGASAAQPRHGEGLPRPPAELVQEREDGVGGPDRLQPGQGLLGDGDLDLIQHRVIGPGSRSRARCHEAAPAAAAARRNPPTAAMMAARGKVICRSSTAVPAPGTRYGITCGQYKTATCSAMSRVYSSRGARPPTSQYRAHRSSSAISSAGL